MTDKQIIKTFSDGYCLVLHENRVSLRENNYTKYQIVVGAKTNELFEFVKELYLDNKAKEQECEELKKTVDDLLHKPEIQDKILWKIDNEALLGSKDAYIYKLEKTLNEIKEIAEKIADECQIEPYGACALEAKEQILQKISECEVEND